MDGTVEPFEEEDEDDAGPGDEAPASPGAGGVVLLRYTVEANYAGWRLDKYLCEKIRRASRTRVQEIIENDLVSERRLKPSTTVWPGLTFELRRRVRDGNIVRFSDTAVDLNAKTVSRAGTPIELTAQEFKLLGHFVSHPGHTFSREELISGAWGYGYEGTARTVDNFVSQLRAKFEPAPEEPRHFKTVRGLGYRFDA
jgi:DNA-binding response OmpR family regulator